MRHQLAGDLPRQRRLQPALDVDGGQLTLLCHGVFGKLGSLARQVGLFGVRLRMHRDVFAGRHRHGTRHQPGHARQQQAARVGVRCRHAHDQAGGRHNAVVGAQYRSAQPADAGGAVFFKVSHGGLLSVVFRRGNRAALVAMKNIAAYARAYWSRGIFFREIAYTHFENS